MKEYIDKNYRKKLTLQMIASRFYISPASCSFLLKESLNMTFNDYINAIRLQKAKQLLSETNLSVNKISDEVGYSNPKYFFKIFKTYSGFTPLEYRFKNNTEVSEKNQHENAL
jgi:YesN/AraC family two-component response regulator